MDVQAALQRLTEAKSPLEKNELEHELLAYAESLPETERSAFETEISRFIDEESERLTSALRQLRQTTLG